MPPKFRFTREEIVDSALNLIREGGTSALTARSLAERLGCSVKPIFSLFKNMDEVRLEVMTAAKRLRRDYMKREIESKKFPPYKSIGIAYIRFAKEEKELFKLLFMRDRSHEIQHEDDEEIKRIVEIIEKSTGLSAKDALLFQNEMWIYVHGIATMIATSYHDWDWDYVGRVLTDGFEGLKKQYAAQKQDEEQQLQT